MKKELSLCITATLLLLVLTLSMSAKPRPSSCRIFYLAVGDSGGRSSYTEDLGRFQVDGLEGETIRSFTFEDLVVTAGLDHVYMYSGKRDSYPYAVDVAITVSNSAEEKIFEKVFSSEASTLDKKNWNLSVTKNFHWKDATYMFTLSCREGSSLPRRK